jgi:hypothetical protein
MEPTMAGHEAIDHDDLLGHELRVIQLTRLGIPWPLAQAADHIDWHQMARLVQGVWGGATEEERRVLRSNPQGPMTPRRPQVLIAVQAAGMNPMDVQIASGGWRERSPARMTSRSSWPRR